MNKQERMEEAIAHLSRVVDDLSDVVARQDNTISRMERQLHLLLEKEALREQEGGSLPLGDERPPHY